MLTIGAFLCTWFCSSMSGVSAPCILARMLSLSLWGYKWLLAIVHFLNFAARISLAIFCCQHGHCTFSYLHSFSPARDLQSFWAISFGLLLAEDLPSHSRDCWTTPLQIGQLTKCINYLSNKILGFFLVQHKYVDFNKPGDTPRTAPHALWQEILSWSPREPRWRTPSGTSWCPPPLRRWSI